MTQCPWCRADVGDAPSSQPCHKCGRIPAQHASLATADAALDLQLDLGGPAPAAAPATPPSFDGDLDLAPISTSAPVPAASAPRSNAAVAAPPGAAFGSLDDDDVPESSDLALDLGGGGALPAGLGAARTPRAADGSASSSGAAAAVRSEPQGPPPVSDFIDPFEARALADYGPAPDGVIGTPMYALRVLQRKSELGRILALKKDEAAAAARAVEDAFVAFAARARSVGEREQLRSIEPILAAEELLRSRDGALASEMDAHKAELAKVDEKMATIEAELASARAEEQVIAEELARVTEVKTRAEVRLRRADIEIRNAMKLLEAKEGEES